MKYYFFILLFIVSACSTTSSNQPPKPPPPDNKSAVDTIDISFPAAVFTDLGLVAAHDHSRIIKERLASLINAAPKETSIYLSVYGFRKVPSLISAIKKAVDRNVKVHVELDMSSRSNNTSTVNKLKEIDGNIDIVGIQSDAGPTAINHNKLALFSAVTTKNGTAKNVVFTSSENWGPRTGEKIQNAAILSNKGLYQAYLQYWQEMKKRATSGMKDYNFKKYSAPKEGIWAYFYPKRKNGVSYGSDTIVDMLDGITDPSSTTIQIEMPFWTDCRIDILNKLKDLKDQGAKIEVVVRSNVGDQVHNGLITLAQRGAFVKMYNFDETNKSVQRIFLHSKVIMIRGEWKGKKTNIVITGSENFTCNALKRNNENNLLLSSYNFKHPGFFKDYEDNFEEMKKLPGICCTKKD